MDADFQCHDLFARADERDRWRRIVPREWSDFNHLDAAFEPEDRRLFGLRARLQCRR